MLAGLLLNLDYSEGGRSRRRRKVVLGDRLYDVRVEELPALLEAWLARGETPAKSTGKRRSSAAAPPRRVEPEPLPAPIVEVQARYTALVAQYADDGYMRNLLNRLIERFWRDADEDDIEVLLWN